MLSTEGVPSRIGAYEIVRRLPSAEWADVYLGRMGTGRPCELQVMRAPVDREGHIVERLARETEVCGRLSHPAIVRTVDCFEHAGHMVLVVEHTEGAPLGRLLEHVASRREHLRDDAAWYIGHQLAGALACAHEATDAEDTPTPLVHGCVHPGTVLVTHDGQVRLTGFVAGTLLRHGSGRGSIDAAKVGGFIAPEQARGERVTPRSDVYAVALLLWRVLTDRAPPRPGASPEGLSSLRDDLPVDVACAIDLSLVPSADRRRMTCTELEQWFAGMVFPERGRSELAEKLLLLSESSAAAAQAPRARDSRRGEDPNGPAGSHALNGAARGAPAASREGEVDTGAAERGDHGIPRVGLFATGSTEDDRQGPADRKHAEARAQVDARPNAGPEPRTDARTQPEARARPPAQPSTSRGEPRDRAPTTSIPPAVGPVPHAGGSSSVAPPSSVGFVRRPSLAPSQGPEQQPLSLFGSVGVAAGVALLVIAGGVLIAERDLRPSPASASFDAPALPFGSATARSDGAPAGTGSVDADDAPPPPARSALALLAPPRADGAAPGAAGTERGASAGPAVQDAGVAPHEATASPAAAAPPSARAPAPTAVAQGIGVLTVGFPQPGDVYLNGKLAGPANQPLQVPCSRWFVRVGVAERGGPPRWLAPGRSIEVPCQAAARLDMKPGDPPPPRPYRPGIPDLYPQ